MTKFLGREVFPGAQCVGSMVPLESGQLTFQVVAHYIETGRAYIDERKISKSKVCNSWVQSMPYV
jgi:hypothetical protein